MVCLYVSRCVSDLNVCVYVYVCVYLCLHASLCACVSMSVCLYLCVYVCVYMCPIASLCACVSMSVCLCLCVYACVSMPVCLCLCVYMSLSQHQNSFRQQRTKGGTSAIYWQSQNKNKLPKKAWTCLATVDKNVSDKLVGNDSTKFYSS